MAERRPTDGRPETGGWFQRLPWVLTGVLEIGGWLIATQFAALAQPWQVAGYLLGSGFILIGAAAFCVHVAWRMRRGDPRLAMFAACVVITSALLADSYMRFMGDVPTPTSAEDSLRDTPGVSQSAPTPDAPQQVAPLSRRVRGDRENIVQNREGDNRRFNPLMPARGAIYQGTSQVGDFPADVEVDEKDGLVKFKSAHFTAFPDPAQPLRYENVLMMCAGIPHKEQEQSGGRILSVQVDGPTCKIVGHVAR